MKIDCSTNQLFNQNYGLCYPTSEPLNVEPFNQTIDTETYLCHQAAVKDYRLSIAYKAAPIAPVSWGKSGTRISLSIIFSVILTIYGL
jgi:hypothetical protein